MKLTELVDGLRAGIDRFKRSDAVGQLWRHPGIAAPEAAHAVAEAVVPFQEGGRIGPQLIAARADIPGSAISLSAPSTGSWRIASKKPPCGSKPCASRPRRWPDQSGSRRRFTPDPQAERCPSPAATPAAGPAPGVAGAGVVDIASAGRRSQPVIERLSSPRKDSAARGIAFAGVIVDDVEDDFDAGGMQRRTALRNSGMPPGARRGSGTNSATGL